MAGIFWMYRDIGSHTQNLAMGKGNAELWPEDTIECLASVGEVLFNALYRRQAEVEAERLQRLEQVIANTAARLVHLSASDVDAEVSNALAKIGETADADLCVFVRCIDQDTSTPVVSHEWSIDTVVGPVLYGSSLAGDYPWLARQLKKRKPLRLSNPSDFALKAPAEFELFERFGIQSMAWEPFQAAHGTRGYIGLGTVNRESRWLDGVFSQVNIPRQSRGL